jgi:hypothetical protein
VAEAVIVVHQCISTKSPAHSCECATQTSRTSKAKKLGGNTSWRLNIKLLSGRDLVARDTTATGDYGTSLPVSLANIAICVQKVDPLVEE